MVVTSQLFRNAIAKSLSRTAQINEKTILTALGTPKAATQQQFGIPVPRLLTQCQETKPNAVDYCQDLAKRV